MRKKKKRIGLVILLLMFAAVAYLLVRFYPVWRAAEFLAERMDTAHCAYEVEAELDLEKLQESQKSVLKNLTKVTGFGENSMTRLTIKGEIWEDTIHALVFPRGSEAPFIELYLSDDIDVINEALIYNAIRSHLVEQYKLLDYLMPEQKEELFMTLEQVEELFGMDLGDIRNFSLPYRDEKPKTWQFFLMLAAMTREDGKTLDHYILNTEQVALQFEIPKETGDAVMAMKLQIKHMAGVAELSRESALILEEMGFLAEDSSTPQVLKSFSISIVPGGNEIAMPTKLANQSIVDLISKIRSEITKIWGRNQAHTEI